MVTANNEILLTLKFKICIIRVNPEKTSCYHSLLPIPQPITPPGLHSHEAAAVELLTDDWYVSFVTISGASNTFFSDVLISLFTSFLRSYLIFFSVPLKKIGSFTCFLIL